MPAHGGVGEQPLVAGAARNAGHHVVGTPVEEERHRVTVAPRLVDHAVHRGLIKIVGPPRVADAAEQAEAAKRARMLSQDL